jgi:hypothetical protein
MTRMTRSRLEADDVFHSHPLIKRSFGSFGSLGY